VRGVKFNRASGLAADCACRLSRFAPRDGIYVYHFFLVLSLSRTLHALFGRSVAGFVAMLLVIGLASYAVAALSFRFIEAPALRLKRFFPRPA
jgi:peptidoglycan/LPS O-acetylase OafA/YrhL